MRELYVVAVTSDGGHLVLASRPDAAKGSHVLAVDARLQAALRGTLPAPGTAGAVESALSPKEVQARLRAGETPEQVAKIAGVPVTRVLRYAGPVMSERARMVDEAREAIMAKARAGASAVPMGAAADLHLAETPGLKADTVDWTARRRDDGSWIVRLSFVARGRSRAAEWAWDPAQRVVTALDAYAGKLGYVAASRPTASEPARKPARRSGGPAKPSAASGTARKAAAAGKTASGKTAPKRAAGSKTATKKVPAKKAAAKKAAAKRSGAKAATSAPMPRDQGVRAAGDGKRAAVPTWSDVLLGTRPPAPAKRNGGSAAAAGLTGTRTTGTRRSARG